MTGSPSLPSSFAYCKWSNTGGRKNLESCFYNWVTSWKQCRGRREPGKGVHRAELLIPCEASSGIPWCTRPGQLPWQTGTQCGSRWSELHWTVQPVNKVIIFLLMYTNSSLGWASRLDSYHSGRKNFPQVLVHATRTRKNSQECDWFTC